MMKPLDTHMLVCLDALVAEGHVSRAAARVGIGQPAMSQVLARLRDAFGDPLLVRTRGGMTPTPRALHAAENARQALRLLDDALKGGGRTDPRTLEINLRIVALSSLAFSILPKLVRRLEEDAPGVRVQVHQGDVRRTGQMLESNECDLVLGHPPGLGTALHAQTLFKIPLVCIARSGHPHLHKKITLDQYVELPHVVLGGDMIPVATIESAVERSLRRRRLERKVGVRVPDLLVSLAVVAGTDLIATVPERLVREFAGMLDLQMMPAPLTLAVPNIVMVWHERSHHDKTHRFLRQIVREVGNGIS